MVPSGQRAERDPAEARQLTRAPGQLRGIDHVQLAMPAGDEAERAAESFYGEVLGLTRVPKPEAMAARGGCWFESPFVKLHLGVEEPFHPARKAHPALLVDDLDALEDRIVATGGELRPANDLPGTRRFHCDDPFGNRIELIELCGPTPEMFEVFANHSLYPLTMLDELGTIRWASASVERFFGYPPADVIGKSFEVMVAPYALDAAVEAFGNISEAYEVTPWGGVGYAVDLLHVDGSSVPCEVAALSPKRSGLPWYVIYARLAGYERALDQAVEAMASGASLAELLTLTVTALETMLPEAGVAVGDRWTHDQFGVTAGSAATLLKLHPLSPWARAMRTGTDQFVDCEELPGPLAALAQAEGYAACWVHPVSVGTDDKPIAAVVVWRTVPGPPQRFSRSTLARGGQLLRLVLQWDRSHRTLEFAATHDPLTGLANRQAFRDRLTTLARNREGRAAVLYLDLDRFKPVNDLLGHQVGDRVLAIVAQRLVAALRPGDLVARMGGDEFAVLCERLTTPDDVERVAERLLEVVRQPISRVAPDDVCLDVSIGIADIRGGGDELVDTVLARSDEALRKAKHDGRGRWARHRL